MTTLASKDNPPLDSFIAPRRTLLPFLLLVPLVGFLFFHRLGARDLWSSHEARAAMNAQSMLDDGDWLIPHLFDGQLELQKPPLYYWLVSLLAWLRGGIVDGWAVRLPSAFAAAACVLGLAGFGHLRGRPLAGWLAGAFLATAVRFTWQARMGRIDLPLAACIGVAVCSAFLALRDNRDNPSPRSWFFLACVFLALGVMFKGPIALVLAAAILLPWYFLERRLDPVRYSGRRLPRTTLIAGCLLFLVLTIPWFIWANIRTHGELFNVFFWHHNFERAFGGSRLRGHAWWFYGPQGFVDFLPWSPLLIAGLIWCWRNENWRSDAELRFGLIWFLAVAAVLSCFRYKRADYLLPAYPGAALFLGVAAERLFIKLAPARQRWWPVLAGLLLACVTAGWAWKVDHALPEEEGEREYQTFARQIRDIAPPPQPILFHRAEVHCLAFHLGRPLAVSLKWEDLQANIDGPGPHFLVMPLAWVAEAQTKFLGLQWEELGRHPHLAGPPRERPLLLLRAVAPPAR